VQPGRFLTLENALTFHIRERQPNGVLVGIFVNDRRNPNEEVTLLAEQGQIVETQSGSFLVLQNGSAQRRRPNERDPAIVNFDSYAFDLSSFTHVSRAFTYPARERYTWELVAPAPDDPVFQREPGQFRAELHDRIVSPFYPLAFAIIAYAISERRAPRAKTVRWRFARRLWRLLSCGSPALSASWAAPAPRSF
jgi:lipopolysaccharide export system permease protein